MLHQRHAILRFYHPSTSLLMMPSSTETSHRTTTPPHSSTTFSNWRNGQSSYVSTFKNNCKVMHLGQGLYRLRQSTIGTSYGGVALQWRRLCGCVHEGAMARPWTGNGQFCSAINGNNRRKTCTALSFFRFPVKLLCM